MIREKTNKRRHRRLQAFRLFSCDPMYFTNDMYCDGSMHGIWWEFCIKTHIAPSAYGKQRKRKQELEKRKS